MSRNRIDRSPSLRHAARNDVKRRAKRIVRVGDCPVNGAPSPTISMALSGYLSFRSRIWARISSRSGRMFPMRETKKSLSGRLDECMNLIPLRLTVDDQQLQRRQKRAAGDQRDMSPCGRFGATGRKEGGGKE